MTPKQRHVSPDGKLVLLVHYNPDNKDWTVGFEGSAWHTHGDVLAPTFGGSDEDAVNGFVQQILADQLVIGIIPLEEGDQMYVTNTPEADVPAQQAGMLRLRYWSGTPYTCPQSI